MNFPTSKHPRGSILRRDDLGDELKNTSWAEPDGFLFLVSRNYQVNGPYCADQMIELFGWMVRVYSPKNRTYCQASAEFDSADDFLAGKEALKQVADSKCSHRSFSHVAVLGRCYNRYLCHDCGQHFEVDSSD